MNDVSGITPVTIFNGFLGAGKTTLLQNLLVQAREFPDVRLGVIVNEMSELDIDGLILDTSEVLSLKDAMLIPISAVSISGPEGLEQFSAAVGQLRSNGATHIFVETSGSTHPWPLLEMIRSLNGIRLHGFISLVDTVTLAQDHDLGRSIVPSASRNLAANKRGIENLLAEQIMFANRILLSKMDHVSPLRAQNISAWIYGMDSFAYSS